mgnify:CR=1 FL=1
MAVAYYNPSVLNKGLEHIVNNANEMRVVSSYTTADTYAKVVSNTVCLISVAPSDLVLGDQGVNGRQITVGAKSGTASANSGAGPDLHVALCISGQTEVTAVTDETTDQEITNGNPINVQSFTLKMNQPTLV